MIELHSTIIKGKKEFFVRNDATNGKNLHTTETLKTKASAKNNIHATKQLYFGSKILKVKDCTGKKEKIIFI